MGKTRKAVWGLLIIVIIAIGVFAAIMIFSNPQNISNPTVLKKKEISKQRVPIKANEILPFLKENGYSSQLVLLVDMSLSLHQKRLYAVNPSSMDILHTCLVSHGKGGNSTDDVVHFSNTPNSWCSSLGRYKIAERYTGQFGESYRLDGLDSTNSNARSRAVVFHYYEHQSSLESVGPHYFSEGCPMLAESDWRLLDEQIQKQNKPCILWIYN